MADIGIQIAQELVVLAQKLQTSVSSDGSNLTITPPTGKAVKVKQLRSSVIQVQTVRLR